MCLPSTHPPLTRKETASTCRLRSPHSCCLRTACRLLSHLAQAWLCTRKRGQLRRERWEDLLMHGSRGSVQGTDRIARANADLKAGTDANVCLCRFRFRGMRCRGRKLWSIPSRRWSRAAAPNLTVPHKTEPAPEPFALHNECRKQGKSKFIQKRGCRSLVPFLLS